jgi:D-ribulokinase
MTFFLGLDFGTSGARAIAIDASGVIQAQVAIPFPTTQAHSAQTWQQVLRQLLGELPIGIRTHLAAIALNGTSGTVLLCNGAGQPLAAPLMYNDSRAAASLASLRPWVPIGHTVLSATSSLAKLWWWRSHAARFADARYLMHQADWLAFQLHGQLGMSDYHNSLKLGYDVVELAYPDWLSSLDIAPLLPKVVAPGTPIGPVLPALAAQFHLPPDCTVYAGTTDSIAAFLASGVTEPGTAVTSLGSTLVLKLLSRTRLESSPFGIYSHRLGDLWLVGGASNTGGAVLKAFFSAAELEPLSAQIDPQQPSGLDYYPLIEPGERFPINDPALAPRLEPRPSDPAAFLHGLLEGIANIETQGYQLLEQLGATPLQRVYSAGGGAKNPTWTAIRQRCLGVPVETAAQTEAAYGSAVLAGQGHRAATNQPFQIPNHS